jgi:hypothetical protein
VSGDACGSFDSPVDYSRMLAGKTIIHNNLLVAPASIHLRVGLLALQLSAFNGSEFVTRLAWASRQSRHEDRATIL